MAKYVGNRIVPIHGGVWDREKSYEELTIVLDAQSGDSFISRKEVPAGTELTQTEYWMLHSLYSQQIAEAAAQMKQTEAALKQRVSDAEQQMEERASRAENRMEERASSAETLSNKNRDDLNNRMDNLETRLDANVTASTEGNADYAAELVDARVDDKDTAFPSAGANVRNIGRLAHLGNILDAWPRTAEKIANHEGTIISQTDWCCWKHIPVNGDFLLIDGCFAWMSAREDYYNIVCYDRDLVFLGGAFRSESSSTRWDSHTVELPEGTAFITVSTNNKLAGQGGVYLLPDIRPHSMLNNPISTWQWMNGELEINTTKTQVTVTPLRKTYLCRRNNGGSYVQSDMDVTAVTVEMEDPKRWWAVYWQDEGMTEDGKKTGAIHVEQNENWHRLFTPDRFVFAAFYNVQPVFVSPASMCLTVNGVNYGNPAVVAQRADSAAVENTHTAYLYKGSLSLDIPNRTVQVTEDILAVTDNRQYKWVSAHEEPEVIPEYKALERNEMLILGLDHSTGRLNLYDTSAFRALKANGYYIAAVYQNRLWNAHMTTDLPILFNGKEYKAGDLFYEQYSESFVEGKYRRSFDPYLGSVMFLASGKFSFDDATIQVTEKMLGVTENLCFEWVQPQEEPVEQIPVELPDHMRILGYDRNKKELNLYDNTAFRNLGRNGYYIAAWYQGKFYNPHMSPDVSITYMEKEYKAGQLFASEKDTYVEKKYRDYVKAQIKSYVDGYVPDFVEEYVADALNPEEDTLGDIVSPSHWDCMEGRQFSMFFDCLTRNEGRDGLYRVTNSKSLTRNEYCLNYTPKETDTDFSVNIIRLDKDTLAEAERKPVKVRVHHPISKELTKNVCICGDSLVDCNRVATEVYRLLEEDGDCIINQLGTRGPENGRHEGRGSWKWYDYLHTASYAGKDNAFLYDGKLNFRQYCEENGYEGIDYFLIALGTNDVSQGSTLYRTEAQVQKFVDYAKEFVDALLSEETGYPSCKVGIGLCGPGSDYSYLAGSSMAIFRKSINTLNLAMIKTFDEGAYHKNVTCFAHGLRTDRRLAFPYSEKPVTSRFTETSRTLTNSIHPSTRGYEAWADGYYCQIRAWLTEDAASAAAE